MGICYLAFGDKKSVLEKYFLSKYPNGQNKSEDPILIESILDVGSYFDGSGSQLNYRIDVIASTFCRRVWHELIEVRYGTLTTYTELAIKVCGNPHARRAVARCCALNPVLLIIPCHRVIRADGTIGGYRSGGWRKRALIKLETNCAEIQR